MSLLKINRVSCFQYFKHGILNDCICWVTQYTTLESCMYTKCDPSEKIWRHGIYCVWKNLTTVNFMKLFLWRLCQTHVVPILLSDCNIWAILSGAKLLYDMYSRQECINKNNTHSQVSVLCWKHIFFLNKWKAWI